MALAYILLIFFPYYLMSSCYPSREQLRAQLQLDFYIDEPQDREYLIDFLLGILKAFEHQILPDFNALPEGGIDGLYWSDKEFIVFKGTGHNGTTILIQKIKTLLGWRAYAFKLSDPKFFYGRDRLLEHISTPVLLIDTPIITNPTIIQYNFLGRIKSYTQELLETGIGFFRRPGETGTFMVEPVHSIIYTSNDLANLPFSGNQRIINFSRDLDELRNAIQEKVAARLPAVLANIVGCFY